MKTCTTLLLILCLCLLSFSAYAADNMLDQLSAHEKTLWEAIKNQKMDAFSAGTAPDIMDVDPMGVVMTKQQLMDSFKTLTITDYTLSNWKTFTIDEDAVVLIYSADGTATMNGQPVPMKVTHTTTYVKEGGKWWPKFHTETPIAPPPAQTQ
jgi:hypothetical protein